MLPIMNANSWFPTLFNDLLNSDEWMPGRRTTEPAVNVKEDAKAYTMEVAVPGIRKEFCRVNINADGNLDIAIENKLEHKEEDKKERYLRREFCYSNYQQTYVLPEDIEKDGISAKVDNGVLTVTMPKVNRQEVKEIQRRIEIA